MCPARAGLEVIKSKEAVYALTPSLQKQWSCHCALFQTFKRIACGSSGLLHPPPPKKRRSSVYALGAELLKSKGRMLKAALGAFNISSVPAKTSRTRDGTEATENRQVYCSHSPHPPSCHANIRGLLIP